MKRIYRPLLAILCSVILLSGAFAMAGAKAEKFRVMVWTPGDQMKKVIRQYYTPTDPDENLVIKVLTDQADKYANEVNRTLIKNAAAADAPDLFVVESEYVKRFADSRYTLDLTELGFTEEDFANVYPSVLEIGGQKNGVRKALSWQACPIVLVYRASLAEKYLGVQTPEEFQDLVKDNATFLETARKLGEASGGVCKMASGEGDFVNFQQWDRENEGQEMTLYQMYSQLKKEGLLQNKKPWTKGWYRGMNGQLETLCYFLPMWGIRGTLMGHCGVDTTEKMKEEQVERSSKRSGGTYGDWRVVSGPTHNVWGGTFITVNKMKYEQASDEKKAAIKELIWYLTLNDEFLVQYAKDTKEFVSSKTAVRQLINSGEMSFGILGGQDPYPVMDEAARDFHIVR